MLYLKCKGQVMSIDVDERFADKYINANTVHFEFCDRWAGMRITAQFTQNEKTYDVLVDEVTNTVTLPNEITFGEVDISVFGVHPETGVRITTIPVKKKIEKSGFVGDGETPIPPTPDLYAQLIAKIEDAEGNEVAQIQAAVDKYLDENPVQAGATIEQAEQIEANKKAIEENKQAIENYTPPVTSVNGMTGDVVIATGGGTADSIEWSKVTDKPVTYPPDPHTHSYNDLANKPTIPVVPSFLPNPHALTINGQSYDGSKVIEVTIDVSGGTAVNLLDNSDFTNLVAQAGIGQNHANGLYAADRWKLVSGSVSYAPGTGLTLNGTIKQIIEKKVSNVSTFVGMESGSADIVFDQGNNAVEITSNGGVLKWAALYSGAYHSAPEYRPKGYGVELVECARYYQTCGPHYCYENTTIQLMPPMRIMPDTTGSIMSYSSADGWVTNDNGLFQAESYNAVRVYIPAGNDTMNSVYVHAFADL